MDDVPFSRSWSSLYLYQRNPLRIVGSELMASICRGGNVAGRAAFRLQRFEAFFRPLAFNDLPRREVKRHGIAANDETIGPPDVLGLVASGRRDSRRWWHRQW